MNVNTGPYSFRDILNLVDYCADEYGMREVVSYVMKHNEAKGEYHNTTHLLGVTGIMLYILDYRLNTANKYRATEFRRCMLAGLFHDMNHLCMGRDGDDSENIVASIAALKMYQNESSLDIHGSIYREAERMIADSQYPYADTRIDIYSKLLRDADMLYTMFNHDALIGLFYEMKYTKEEFYQQQKKFINEVEFHWSISKNIARSLRGKQLAYLNSKWGEI